jgi:hypothetical protein
MPDPWAVGLAATPDLRALDLATMPDSFALVSDAWPKCLGPGSAARLKGFESALLPLPSNLNQVPLFSPKFLGSGRGCQTQVNINNNNNNNNNWFYLSNQIFTFLIVIIFIVNLIILMNLIMFIILIIIFNLFVQILIFFI